VPPPNTWFLLPRHVFCGGITCSHSCAAFFVLCHPAEQDPSEPTLFHAPHTPHHSHPRPFCVLPPPPIVSKSWPLSLFFSSFVPCLPFRFYPAAFFFEVRSITAARCQLHLHSAPLAPPPPPLLPSCSAVLGPLVQDVDQFATHWQWQRPSIWLFSPRYPSMPLRPPTACFERVV